MPEEGIEPLKHDDILTYEEIIKLAQALISIGINNFKLTGGEPLARLGVPDLVARLKDLEGIGEVTLTTNGVLLEDQGKDLLDAGIDRINISLDTMDRSKFEEITRRDKLDQVLRGIDLVLDEGFENLKINTVPTYPLDLDDLRSLVDLGKDRPIDIRFIKLMPIGLGDPDLGYGEKEILDIIEGFLGRAKAFDGKRGNGPASYYSFDNYRSKIGFIDAIDKKFCSSCNRIRLSSTGFLKLCLHYDIGEDIRPYIKDLETQDLARALEEIIYSKPLMHHMGERILREENKNMNQIGG